MDAERVEDFAKRLLSGEIALDQFVQAVAPPTMAEFAEVTLDLDRARRCGFPEVVYGEGKSVETLAKIFQRLGEHGTAVLATRVSADKAETLGLRFPTSRYNALARTFRIPAPRDESSTPSPRSGRVALITAGSSDLPVAEEARETLDWMGVEVTTIHDVGVAGPHRLPAHLPKLQDWTPSWSWPAWKARCPAWSAATSIAPWWRSRPASGTEPAFGGLAALLGMLNSCASNVTVVNIDSGFKGAYIAGLIASRRQKASRLPVES
jgi:pyridinium-3,5-biscarboxylic acid mononucleotide synthase